MSPPLLKRVPGVEAFQNFREIAASLALLLKGWFYRGKTITITTVVGSNTLQHGLGRAVTKIFPVMQSASATFYYAATGDPKQSITVVSTGAAEVTFYVD